MNHNHFTFFVLACAILLSCFIGQFSVSSLEILTTKVINVALLMTVSMSLITFTKGTKYDVLKEIFEEHNASAALYIGFFILSLAIAVTVCS